MNISIIIPTKNRAKILEETVSNIFLKQKHFIDRFEVLIVNDGNEPLNYLAQKYQNLKTLKNKGTGAAQARNTGAQEAKNELLLFIDDDMLIDADCLYKHLALHEKFKRVIISGSWKYDKKMLDLLNSSPFGRYKLQYDYKSLEGKEEDMISPGIYHCNVLASFNLSILKQDFTELGGFNTRFPFAGCEDQELTMRAIQKGFELLLDKSNICINNEKDRVDMEKWFMRQYTGVQGYILLCDLFPYKKQEPLYIENGPIGRNDNFKIRLKKSIKYLLSRSPVLWVTKLLTHILETLHIDDKVLFKIYNGLSGLYIYKGFRYSQNLHLKI